MSKTTIALGVLASVLAQSAANAATPASGVSIEPPSIGSAPVISDAAKAQILKSDYFQVAGKKRPFVRAFVQESGPTFAQYTQSLKHIEDVEAIEPVADIRTVFERFRTVG